MNKFKMTFSKSHPYHNKHTHESVCRLAKPLHKCTNRKQEAVVAINQLDVVYLGNPPKRAAWEWEWEWESPEWEAGIRWTACWGTPLEEWITR